MTQEHPITPPPELVQQWWDGTHGALYEFEAVTTQAARWGSDQELEACCEWLDMGCYQCSLALRATRRPKPPSLKELALKSLKDIGDACESEGFCRANEMDIIRRALESLPS
jgi:hypothetical protein